MGYFFDSEIAVRDRNRTTMHGTKTVYICHTPYHVLIACEKVLAKDCSLSGWVESNDIVILDTVRNVDALKSRIQKSEVFNNVIILKHKEVFSWWTNTSFYKSLAYCVMRRGRVPQLDFLDDYNNIYIFNDHRDLGAYLHYKGMPYHLLEDGRDCFKVFDQAHLDSANAKVLRKVLKDCFSIPLGMGESRCCLDIEVNDCVELRTLIDKPIRTLPKHELAESLSDLGKKKIRIVFPCPEQSQSGEPSILLLTSPREARGKDWSRRMQRDYYIKVGNDYCGYKIFLKPHPRDDADYTLLPNNFTLLEKDTPIEVLDLYGNLAFDIGITYMSTALASLTCCKVKIQLKDSSSALEKR